MGNGIWSADSEVHFIDTDGSSTPAIDLGDPTSSSQPFYRGVQHGVNFTSYGTGLSTTSPLDDGVGIYLRRNSNIQFHQNKQFYGAEISLGGMHYQMTRTDNDVSNLVGNYSLASYKYYSLSINYPFYNYTELDEVTEIKLHRAVDYDVNGAQSAYVVQRVITDDGDDIDGVQQTYMAFDYMNGRMSKAGHFATFSEVTVLPGTYNDVTSSPYFVDDRTIGFDGQTCDIGFEGSNPNIAEDCAFLKEALPAGFTRYFFDDDSEDISIYGSLRLTQKFDYAMNMVNSESITREQYIYDLGDNINNAYYALTTSKLDIVDGLSSTTSYYYNDYNQLVETKNSYINSDFNEETISESTLYAHEVESELDIDLIDKNILSLPLTKFSEVGEYVVGKEINFFDELYGIPYLAETWIQDEDFESVSSRTHSIYYTDYKARKVSEITARDAFGRAVEVLGVDDKYVSTVYGYQGTVPLGTFINARIDQVYYEDFEDGSAIDGWPGLMNNEPYIVDGAMILYKGALDNVSPEITLSGDAIVEFDVRFSDGVGEAQVELNGTTTLAARINASGQVSLEGASTVSEQLTFDAKAWKHVRITKVANMIQLYIDGVRVLSLAEDLGSTFFTFIGDGGDIAYDHVRIYPAEALAETKSLHPLHKYIESVQGADGLTVKKLYNDRMQSVASIDAYGRVVKTSIDSYRLNNNYKDTSPDMKTETLVLGEQTFYDDFSYEKDWVIHDSGQGTTWDLNEEKQLEVRSPGGGSGVPDAYTLDLRTEMTENVSIEFDIKAGELPWGLSLGILVGDNTFDGYTMGSTGNSIAAVIDGDLFKVRKSDGSIWEYHYVVSEIDRRSYRVKIDIDKDYGTVHYYVDGRLVGVESVMEYVGVQKIAFVDYAQSGNMKWYIDNLVVYEGGIQSSVWFDAAGKSIQQQQEDGFYSQMITQTFYDRLGRPEVTTKPVTLTTEALEFLPGYASYDGDQMTGLVSDLNPECNNYPFTRVVYDGSPLSRAVEQYTYGDPVHANRESTYVLDQGTGAVRTLFGSYKNATREDDNLVIKELTDRDDNSTYQLYNALGQLLVQASEEESGSYIMTGYEYDIYGNVDKILSPNYFNPPHGSADQFISTKSYNTLGQMEHSYTTDGGDRTYEYDESGKLIAMRTQQNINEGKEQYWIYDDYDRVVEEGIRHYAASEFIEDVIWTSTNIPNGIVSDRIFANNVTIKNGARAFVGKQVNINAHEIVILPDTEFPEGSNITLSTIEDDTWKKRYTYYEHGDMVAANYTIKQVEINENEDDLAEVIENYAYDVKGRLITKGQLTSGYDQEVRDINYGYDESNRVKTIDYSDGLVIQHYYDEVGRLRSIGTPDEYDTFAYYTYDSHGQLGTESLNNNFTFKTEYTYDAEGRVISLVGGISGQWYRENLYYNSLSDGSAAGYNNGRIAEITHQYQNIINASDYSSSYQYDDLGRLTNEKLTLGGVATSYQTRYDDNSNITSRTMPSQDNQTKTYSYYAGTNKLQNWDGSGDDYSYDANSNTISNTNKSLTFTYDDFTDLVKTYVSGGSGMFHYGASNQRVLKTGDNKDVLYIHGANDYPLVEYHRESDGTERKYVYIYGLTGLIASEQGDGEWKFLIKDHLGSIRVVFDGDNNAVEGHGYLAYGDKLFTTSIEETSYQYTGQERDPELDLSNYRARLYDEETGQFYGMDPAGQFHSPFSYVGGNPVSFVDPTGKWGLPAIAQILIGAGLSYLGQAAENISQGMTVEEAFSLDNNSIMISGTFETDWGYVSSSDQQMQHLANDPSYNDGFSAGDYFVELGNVMEYYSIVGKENASLSGYEYYNESVSLYYAMACNSCPISQSGGSGFLGGYVDGFIGGAKSTLDFAKGVVTFDGGAWGAILKQAIGPLATLPDQSQSALELAKALPDATSYDFGYGAGFVSEKVVEALVLRGVSKGVVPIEGGFRIPRLNNLRIQSHTHSINPLPGRGVSGARPISHLNINKFHIIYNPKNWSGWSNNPRLPFRY